MIGRTVLFRRSVLFTLALALMCDAETPDRRKSVLLVYYTDGSIPANMQFEQTLQEDLRKRYTQGLDFYREQLDAARFPKQVEERAAEIRSRYAGREIDVVVLSGNIPILLIPKTPVIQVDNASKLQDLERVYGNNVVHIRFEIDVLKIVSAAQRLQPDARRILLISGASETDHIYLEQFRDRIAKNSTLAVTTIDNATVPELRDLVSHLPRDVIAIPTTYFSDPNGLGYVPREVFAELATVASVPLYAVSDTYVGKGLLGGYVVSHDKTAHEVTNAISQIFSGKKTSDVVLNGNGTGEYLFDWRELKRWGFSEKDLPADHVVKFKTLTLWEEYRWLIIGIVSVIILQKILIVALLVHRYERKKAEKSLRDMTGRLLSSQDEERRRIARDLHDGTGQQLSGIALGVGQVLADFPPGNDRLRQLLQDSHVASRQALEEVRAVSYALHPPILDGLGLLPALQWYLDGMQKRTEFSIDLDISEARTKTPPEIERTLFRIVQESVGNALHHSGGSMLKVKLYDCLHGIHLQVEDNGHGIDPFHADTADVPVSIGVGIAGMQERVRQFDGTIEIDSTPNGTRVLVFLPC